jgi:hypothetical protein
MRIPIRLPRPIDRWTAIAAAGVLSLSVGVAGAASTPAHLKATGAYHVSAPLDTSYSLSVGGCLVHRFVGGSRGTLNIELYFGRSKLSTILVIGTTQTRGYRNLNLATSKAAEVALRHFKSRGQEPAWTAGYSGTPVFRHYGSGRLTLATDSLSGHLTATLLATAVSKRPIHVVARWRCSPHAAI